jgi:hypothetical protein
LHGKLAKYNFAIIMILLRAFLEQGTDVVTQWYVNATGKARAALDGRMIYLRQQPRHGWVREPYDTLRDGIGEVRFKSAHIWHRPLGFFGPGRNEFTFLFFATKTDEFIPRNAIDIAVVRRNAVLNDPNIAIRLSRWGQQ